MEASEEHPDDTIIAEIEPGYRMGDKIIRPARVKVAKNS
jgi:molecular chaperone GrpE